MLNVLLRHVMQFLRVALSEGWLPAQHDSGEQTLPAYLNALADAEAAERARSAKPYTVPYPQVFVGRVLATFLGALLLDPAAGLHVLYEVGQVAEAHRFRDLTDGWSARPFAN